MMVFFENDRCVKCGERLGFFADTLEMSSEKQWAPRSSRKEARGCANGGQRVCNWMVTDANDFCAACRLNEVIPDLSISGNPERWSKLELAKRRCLYTFLQLRLPIEALEGENCKPLRFRLLGDTPNAPPILTGHENGIITINIAEADDDERERRRLKLHEPYRTLVGHVRHESGHYYWDRLVANSPHLEDFRKVFGDESADYKQALEKYYQQGPAAGWEERNVTAYASLHPWEDWAETWAHYLHMVDVMETAASFGLGMNPDGAQNDAPQKVEGEMSRCHRDFDKLLNDWRPLTLALNSINRGMGLPDLYPFVIAETAVEKLRFVHRVIEGSAPT